MFQRNQGYILKGIVYGTAVTRNGLPVQLQHQDLDYFPVSAYFPDAQGELYSWIRLLSYCELLYWAVPGAVPPTFIYVLAFK